MPPFHRQHVVCSGKTAHRIAPAAVLYVCGFTTCPARDRVSLPDKPPTARYTLFKAKAPADRVPCPDCANPAWERVCPDCKSEIPPPNGPSTIAVVGSSASGKTCFIAALIRQIRQRLARANSFRIGPVFEDQRSADFYGELRRAIFDRKRPPDSTQKNAEIKVIRMTLRFPTRPPWWGRLLRSEPPTATVSLGFPDPAGEPLERMGEPYFQEFLQKSAAVVLMVDPFATEKYQEQLARLNLLTPGIAALQDATAPLAAVIAALRGGQRGGRKFRQKLAVVVTKCDEPGVFDPDREPDHDAGLPTFAKQGVPYNPELAARIGRRVEQHLCDDLGMSDLVAAARANFRDVGFFAASALGKPPQKRTGPGGRPEVVLDDPDPRRVEEPLLWVLHRWGYL